MPFPDDVTSPLKNAVQTLPVKLLLLATVLGPPYVIGVFWLANAVLSPDDARFIKDAFADGLKWLVGASASGSVASSLFRTWFKGETRKALATAPAPVAPSPGLNSALLPETGSETDTAFDEVPFP